MVLAPRIVGTLPRETKGVRRGLADHRHGAIAIGTEGALRTGIKGGAIGARPNGQFGQLLALSASIHHQDIVLAAGEQPAGFRIDGKTVRARAGGDRPVRIHRVRLVSTRRISCLASPLNVDLALPSAAPISSFPPPSSVAITVSVLVSMTVIFPGSLSMTKR